MSERISIPKQVREMFSNVGDIKKTATDVGQSQSVSYVDAENVLIIKIDKTKGRKIALPSSTGVSTLVGKCYGNDGLLETNPRRAFQLTYYEKEG